MGPIRRLTHVFAKLDLQGRTRYDSRSPGATEPEAPPPPPPDPRTRTPYPLQSRHEIRGLPGCSAPGARAASGVTLRIIEVTLPTATGGERTLTVGAWEGERGSLTTSLIGSQTERLVEVFDTLAFSERSRGLAIDAPVTARPREPEVTEEGRLREHAFWDGRYTDLFILSVLRATWAEQAPAVLGRLRDDRRPRR